MAMVLEQQRTYTLDDVREMEAQQEGKRFELVEGEIVEKMGTSFLPSTIALNIAYAIKLYLRQNPIGYVTGADGSYIMSLDTKLIPDVGYISKARLPEIPEREVPVPPDLAVEVVSPTDDPREAQKKALLYLQFGVQMVWIVYPQDQTVDIFRPAETGANLQTLNLNGILSGESVLLDFELPVSEIFRV